MDGEKKMDVQYLNLLQDTSKKRLLYLVEYISPKFSKDELAKVLEEIEGKSSKSKKTLVELGKDSDTNADLSKLSLDQLKLMYQVFISKEINDKTAIKWRLYQFLKYSRAIEINKIQVNMTGDDKQLIDLVVETADKKIILFTCVEVLELKDYKSALTEVIKFAKEEKLTPDRVIVAANKTYRNIPLDEPFKLDKEEITPELWVELIDDNCPFNGVDMLVVENTELNLAGFNFTNMEDMLDFIYKNSEGGQVSIVKQPGFFSEYKSDESERQLIWKGIMLKKNI
jgi:hypothetical protein